MRNNIPAQMVAAVVCGAIYVGAMTVLDSRVPPLIDVAIVAIAFLVGVVALNWMRKASS